MEILNSDWLINMLKKSSKTPQGRLLGLFEIMDDWLNAPAIIEKIREDLTQTQALPAISNALEHYLTQQAALAGAEEPAMLAHQLYFMLLAAIQEALRVHHAEGFAHAKRAALALITAQTKQEFHFKKSTAYVAVASFSGVAIIAGSVFMLNGFNLNLSDSPLLIKSATKTIALNTVAAPQAVNETIASPEQTAALFATLEQMRKGNCQFPEALQLPDSYKAVYADNIIGGNISSKVADQKIILQILQKVRCNYTPMLMENSTS